MNAMMHALLFLAALLAATPCTSRAQEVGRLFFTPQERRELDARRRAKVSDRPAGTNAESQHLRIDGYVLRSGGESTVWLNGEAHTRDSRLMRDAEGAGRVAAPGYRFGLRVGESYDTATGQMSDVLDSGELRVIPMKRAQK